MKKYFFLIALALLLTGCANEQSAIHKEPKMPAPPVPLSEDEWRTYQHDQLDFTFQIPTAWKVPGVQFEKGKFYMTVFRPRKIPLPIGKHTTDELTLNYERVISIIGVNDEYEYDPGAMYPSGYYHKAWREIIDKQCNKMECESSDNIKFGYFVSKAGDVHFLIEGYTTVSSKYPLVYFSAGSTYILEDIGKQMGISSYEAYNLFYEKKHLKTFVYSQNLPQEILDYFSDIDQVFNSVAPLGNL